MSGMLSDSIMGTIDHIYCDNTFHVITEQNYPRNTTVRHLQCGTILFSLFWLGNLRDSDLVRFEEDGNTLSLNLLQE